MHLHKPLRYKLKPRAIRYVFVGYASHQKGYRCYHPPSQKLYVTLDVVFYEHEMYYFVHASSIQGENKTKLQTSNYSLDNLDDFISGSNLNTDEVSLEKENEPNVTKVNESN